MNEKLLAAKFKASMEGLERGDVVYRRVDGERQGSVVLKVEQEGGRSYYTVSPFSLILVCNAHPYRVFWEEKYSWLSDEKGSIFLTLEEWNETDKDGARQVLAAVEWAAGESSFEKEQERVARLLTRQTSFYEDAKDLLDLIFGRRDWTRRECELLAAALLVSYRLGREKSGN